MDRTIPQQKRSGVIRIPGSKSQTIRSYLIALFAHGVSTVTGALESSDTLACRNLAESLGATFTWSRDRSTVTIDSSNAFQNETNNPIDCLNSGTTLYLATGMLAATGKRYTITGDKQLKRRPVSALLNAYKDLGVKAEGDTAPFTVEGPITGGTTSIECPTSQYLSSLLLACPLAKGTSTINIPLLYEKPYVRLTMGWLDNQKIQYQLNEEMSQAVIPGGQHYHPFSATIPGDYSSASFFFCMAALSGSSITVLGLQKNDTQGDKKILDVLSAMGCTVTREEDSVTVKGNGKLKGGVFDLNDIPDALPVLAATACLADGDVTFTNVSQARIKETDRIACMHQELEKLGASIEEQPDGMTIHGGKPLHPAVVDGHDDHRIIMALATLSTAIPGGLTISGIDAVDVTFPTFFTLFDALGGA